MDRVGEGGAVIARVLVALASLACVLRAQERRANAESGGPVALCSTPFAWTSDECARFLDGRAGTRLLLQVSDGDADPLAASSLAAKRVELDPGARHAGDATELARDASSAAAIELLGGTWLDWWKVLDFGGKSSRVAQAVREAHRAGVPVLGTGAGASYLARYALVDRGVLDHPARNAHEADPDASFGGLGLVAVTWDATSLPNGSLERELRALLRSSLDEAVFAEGDAAWIVDARAGEARVLAREGAVWHADARSARRMRERLAEGRIARLVDGDRWELGRRRPLAGDAWTAMAPSGDETTRAVASPFDAGALRAVLAPAAAKPFALRLESPACTLRLWTDERTLARTSGGHATLALVAFDAEWSFPDAGADPQKR